MPKNKRHKYERVKHLPNVTISVFGESPPPRSYPWSQSRFEGMQTVLELGCGKGEHSLAFAAADPHRLCVGVDCKSHRMCVGAEQAIAAGLDNVHFLRAWIERIGEFFVDHSIHEIWLPFPDPHPKHRSEKCRLSAPSFLDVYATLLVSGGTVHLKTDSHRLFDYTRQSVDRWGGRVTVASEDLHGEGAPLTGACEVASAYETAARSRGETIKYLAFNLT